MKLVIFDVDGTLVDSQHHIHAAMTRAFEGAGLPPLPMSQVLQIVGLSLPVAIAQLAPDADADMHDRLLQGYRQAFMGDRLQGLHPPLYPGARDCLDALAARDDCLLAVATGKSRRGLDGMIEALGLQGRFVSLQTADGHPSKPHPSMIIAALAETGIAARDAVMIGDTTFDIQMGRAAGVASFGVGWGYHAADALHQAGAALVAADFARLGHALQGWAS